MAYLASCSQDMHNPPQTHIVIYQHIPPLVSTQPLIAGAGRAEPARRPSRAGFPTQL